MTESAQMKGMFFFLALILASCGRDAGIPHGSVSLLLLDSFSLPGNRVGAADTSVPNGFAPNGLAAPGGGDLPPGAPGVPGQPVDPIQQFKNLFLPKANEPAAALVPQDYYAQASMAFAQGAERTAYKLLLAHLVVEPATAKDHYGQVIFSDLLKKPVWALAFGLGSNVERRDYEGYAFPPVTDMKPPLADDKQPLPPGSAPVPGAVEALPAERVSLEQNFGLVVGALEQGFASRWKNGDFGKALSSLPPPEIPQSAPASAPGGPAGAGSPNVSPPAGAPGPNPGAPGPNPGVPGPNPGVPGPNGAKPPAPAIPMFTGDRQLCPGITIVGEGKKDAMLEKARELGLHFLFMLEAKVDRQRSNRVVTNQIQVRLYNVANGDVICSSKAIDNVAIFKNLKRKPAADAVTEAMEPLLSGIDKKVKGRPMPALAPNIVKSRIGSLLVQPMEERLAAMAEVRMYHANGSISDDELSQAMDLMMGSQGLLLLVGTNEQKTEVLDTWVQRIGTR